MNEHKWLFEKNMNFIKKALPSIYEKIKKIPKNNNLFHVSLARKEPVPYIEKKINDHWLPLHSKYNPALEAQKLVSTHDIKTYGALVVGLGFGYVIEEIIEQNPNVMLYVLEPDIQVFLHSLEWKDWTVFPWRSIKRLVIGNDNKSFESFASGFVDSINDDWPMIILPSYQIGYGEVLERLSSFLGDYRKRYVQVANTTLSFERIWHYNAMLNLPYVANTPSYLSLRDQLRNKPVIVVGAGPSLEDSIPFIKTAQENKSAFIFCAGSGVKPLLAHGVVPDAFLTHDPNYVNFENLSSILDRDIPLIFSSTVPNDILLNHKGPKLHYIPMRDNISPLYFGDVNVNCITDCATVTGVLLDVLFHLDVGPIFLTGLDLSVRENKLYASGRNDEDGDEVEEATFKDIYYKAKDYNGNEIYTNEIFEMMRVDLAYLLSNNRKYKVYNLSASGLMIKEAPFIQQDRALKILEQYYNSVSSIESDKELERNSLEKFLANLNVKLNDLLKDIQINILELKGIRDGELNKLLTNSHLAKLNNLKSSSEWKNIIAPMMEGRLKKFNRIVNSKGNEDTLSTEITVEYTLVWEEMDFLVQLMLFVIAHLIESQAQQ